MNVQVQPERNNVVAVQPQMPIKNYHEFYRFYLTEHRHIVSRRLHVAAVALDYTVLQSHSPRQA